MLVKGADKSTALPGLFGLIVALGLVWIVSASPVFGQECLSDPDCDDGQVCNGLEWCDLGSGPPYWCMPGTPIVCDDSDPCTSDYCVEPTGTCNFVPSSDSESPQGPDGLCDTAEDNMPLYGPDAICGTPDDGTGDGVCANLDNCDARYNPGQEDSDRDLIGDACDSTPCLARGLYGFSGSALYRIDPVTAEGVYILSGLTDAKDVVIDPAETQAVVTGGSSGEIWVVDLEARTILTNIGGFLNPWGVDLGASSGQAYFATRDSGEIWGFDMWGGIWPVAYGLSGPTGIDVNAAETTAYVAEETSGEISSVDISTGTITLIASGLSTPLAVELDPTETVLYVIEYGTGTLSVVDIATGVVTPVSPSTLLSPEGLALNADGTIGYVTEQSVGGYFISAVDLSTGVVTLLPWDPMDPMWYNSGLALSPRPPVVMSIPEGEAGLPAASVVVPVNLDDVTGLGVLSADFTVEFNPAVITASSVALGSLTAGCTVTSNLTTPGQAVVSVFCTADLVGAGSIAEITFNVVGVRGQGSPLLITSALLNEGTPPVCADDGTFVVPVDISGRVVYYRDDVTSTEPSTKPVDAAGVDLDRRDWDEWMGWVYNPVGTTSTDCSGDYSFLSLPPILTYRVTPSKANDFESAVDPFDAALNAQHVVGLITLTANQSLAADVTGNGTLTSFDSARIAQFSISLITQFPVAITNGSDWTFVPSPQAEPNQSTTNPNPPAAQPGRIEYSPIIESAENQDFHAILYGDVSGNWVGVCGSPSAPPPDPIDKREQSAGGRAHGNGLLSLPSLHAVPGEEIRVPVRVEDAAQAISFLLDLRYDPAVLELLGTEVGGEAPGFHLETNASEAGRARMALFSASPLDRDAEILVVRFRVVGSPRSRTDLVLTRSRVNEGRIPVTVRDGRVMVLPRPSRQ